MKTIFKSTDEIREDLARHPSDTLAIGRTVLANDRTLLGFIRTALGLLGGGIGLVSYLKHPVIVTVGWLSMALSGILLIWGIRRYIQIRGMMIELSRQNK